MPQFYDDISPFVWQVNQQADMLLSDGNPIAVFPNENPHAVGDLVLTKHAKDMFKLLLFIREHFDLCNEDFELDYVIWTAHTICDRMEDLYQNITNPIEDTRNA